MNCSSGPKKLSITRRVDRESATIVCRTATITVLEDSAGSNRQWFAQALLTQPPVNEGRLELDGSAFQHDLAQRVGFGERMPESASIREYLAINGCDETQIDVAIEELELQKQLYMGVAVLPPPAVRGLQLYLAIRRPDSVMFLNDPFQPFNGRWREYFAAELLRTATQEGRLVVVTNLNFIPQCWVTATCVQRIDVAKLFKPEVIQIKTATREELASQAAALDGDRLERQARATLRIAISEGLISAYREVSDHVFAPLARLSNTFRSYSGALSMFALALIIAVGATIMIPNLPQARAMLVKLSESFGTAEPMAILPEQTKNQVPMIPSPEENLDGQLVEGAVIPPAPSNEIDSTAELTESSSPELQFETDITLTENSESPEAELVELHQGPEDLAAVLDSDTSSNGIDEWRDFCGLLGVPDV